MSKSNFKQIVVGPSLAIALVLGAAACSSTKKASVEDLSPTSQAAAKTGATHFAVISFNKGSSALSAESQESLRQIAKLSKDQGKNVEEVKILSWGDMEMPTKDTRLPKREIDLADRRADAIQDYLVDNQNLDTDIDEHNMAKRPNALSRLFKTDDNNIKRIFEAQGAVPVEGQSLSNFSAKASQAVILVETE
ncbi:MAG: OmpA family protein [Bdellovibrionota bacterium]